MNWTYISDLRLSTKAKKYVGIIQAYWQRIYKYNIKSASKEQVSDKLFRGPSIATAFSECSYYYFIPTTCFGPYGPSSGGIYILVNS
jgi:hypothetical protein